MQAREWMSRTTDQERQAVADRAGTSVGYLWQLSGNHRTAGKALAERLEAATAEITPDRVMTRMELLYPEIQAA